jgi:hypothetical protein
MKRRAVFFMRAYNDMDHFTPVIWKWVTTTHIPVTIVIRMSKEAFNDYRILFLKQFPEVDVRHISEFGLEEQLVSDESRPAKVKPSLLNRAVRKITRLTNPPQKPAKPQKKYDVDGAKVDAMLDTLFDDAEEGVAVFDWVTLSLFHRNFADAVVDYTHRRGYGNISLPHGDTPYYNKMFKLEDINYSGVEHYEDNPSDCVVVPNPLTATRYTPFRGTQELKILGSPRYNGEWMEKLNTLLPAYQNPASEGKLKVLLFLRGPVFPIFWEEVINTVRMVTQFEDMFLVIKHHTRGGNETSPHHREHLELSKLNKMTAPNLSIVYNDIHSGSLLQWADVVLELGTSISFEAVTLNKPILALEFLHSNISTTAHYLPNTALQCKDHLYDELLRLREDHNHRLYTEAEREHFIGQMIHYPDENVLQRFVDVLMSRMTVKEITQ